MKGKRAQSSTPYSRLSVRSRSIQVESGASLCCITASMRSRALKSCASGVSRALSSAKSAASSPRRSGRRESSASHRVRLARFVAVRLEERGDVARDGLAPVVHQAHLYHPRHVELREFPLQQQRHGGDAEGVFGHALVPERARIAVRVLHFMRSRMWTKSMNSCGCIFHRLLAMSIAQRGRFCKLTFTRAGDNLRCAGAAGIFEGVIR